MAQNNPAKALRKKLFVDPKVQGALMVRGVGYWLFALLAVTLLLLCWRVWAVPGRPFAFHLDHLRHFYAPALFASLLLLPVVLMDIVKFSSRFVGPLVRLRNGMRALARGERVPPIRFRKGDFWQEFAKEFNAVAARLNLLQADSEATEAEEAELAGSTR